MRNPVFPMSLLALACSTCWGADALPAAGLAPLTVKSVRFTATPAPRSDIERASAYSTSTAIITPRQGKVKRVPLTHKVLHRSGDFVGRGYAGLIVDHTNQPLLKAADRKGQTALGPFFSAGADGTSLLAVPGARVEGVKGHPLFLINHLEYGTQAMNADPAKPPVALYGKLPMTMNLTVLDQDPVSGQLRPVSVANIDFSGVGGLWIPCNGSTTPWQTHLGSEEYEPDASVYENAPLEPMNTYLGTPGKTVAEGGANPYRYGHMVEVTVAAEGSTRVAKHYSMGRLSFELGDVMADRRTVYFGDDGTDVIRAMYVADKEGDLSAGTLYAARWLQENGAGFGQARLQWIRLGHASDAEIEALIEGGIRFSDIWEVADAAAVAANPGQYVGFKPLFVYGGTGSRAGVRYYRLKPGQAQAAAFLETRRYAAWLGATSEFTKMEGIAHSRAEGKQWTVMSYVRDGMLAGNNGARPADDIRLEGAAADLNCGAVYESQLRGGQRDAAGQPILSDLVAVDMRAVVSGARQPAGAKSGPFDTCDTEKPANPDNIRYSEAMRTLFIGEDSSNHLNNFVWAYSLDSKQATRIFSAPAGGENTGLNVYDNLNGHAYILGNVQHPGAIEDLQHYPPAIREDLRGKVDPRGMVGYLLGLPALQR